jgi:hypothetical protein
MFGSGVAQGAYAGSQRSMLEQTAMLRKILWTALRAALAGLAAIVTRRSAAAIWRTLTGEEPPAKR